MVYKFLRWLETIVTKEQFKCILNATEQDIKFNRVQFGKVTGSMKFIDICTKCTTAVLRGEGGYGIS